MAHPKSKTPVILLAFANDANDAKAPLRELAVEQDELWAIFRQVVRDGKCELAPIAAATAEKVIQAFQEYRGRIKICHYSGHSNEDEIFFKTAYRQQKGIKAESLAEFLALQQGLELVFLNSCLSMGQAEAYHKAGVKAVIATDRAIGDEEARKFSGLFYTSLVIGADISHTCHEAEKGFQLQFGETSRGAGRKAGNSEVEFPWQKESMAF